MSQNLNAVNKRFQPDRQNMTRDTHFINSHLTASVPACPDPGRR